jgi:flagellar biosynthesis/type III secretory pathway chaperone
MNLHSNPRKAEQYSRLMFQFQRTQERIKDIETENTVIDRNTPRELAQLKQNLIQISEQIRRLY